MKIIFDSEEQKEKFLSGVLDTRVCPYDIGVYMTNCIKCKTCEDCWKSCGIEMAVKESED